MKWGPWILHNGVGQPIADGLPVCVAMLDGDIDDEELSDAWEWSWHGSWDGDIIMYRLLSFEPCAAIRHAELEVAQ